MGRESHVVELMARPMSESAAPAADQESVSIHMLTWGMAQLTCVQVGFPSVLKVRSQHPQLGSHIGVEKFSSFGAGGAFLVGRYKNEPNALPHLVFERCSPPGH